MLFKKSAELPTPETALPGRAEPLATDLNHYVSGHPLKGPLSPRVSRPPSSAWAVSGAWSASSGSCRACG